MSDLPITVWLVLTALVAFFVVLTIWSRTATWQRTMSILAFVLASPVVALSLGLTLGWPVPLINGVTLPAGEVLVLGSKMVEGVGIYILVDRGEGTPRYVFQPWSMGVASALQDALDESGEDGTTTMNVPPFEWSWDQHDPSFLPHPQPKVLPDKPPANEPPPVDSDAI